MQSRLVERTGEALQETYEGAIVISVGFSCRASDRWRRRGGRRDCIASSSRCEAEGGVKQWGSHPAADGLSLAVAHVLSSEG